MKKYNILFLLFSVFCVNFLFSYNDENDLISPRKMDIFFYQNNKAFVKDFRLLSPEIINSINKTAFLKIHGFGKNILFNSIRTYSEDFRINYLSKKIKDFDIYDLINKEIYIKTRNFENGKEFIKCKILNFKDNILYYSVNNKIYLENFSDLALKLDKTYYDNDVLYVYGEMLKSVTSIPLEISYFINNLYYETHYNLFMDGKKSFLESFILLYNKSGIDLLDFNLNIVLSNENNIFFKNIILPRFDQGLNNVSSYGLKKNYYLKNETVKQLKFFEVKDIDVKEIFEINDEIDDIGQISYKKIYAEDKLYFENNTDYDFPFGEIDIYKKDQDLENYVLSRNNFLETTQKGGYVNLKTDINPNVYI